MKREYSEFGPIRDSLPPCWPPSPTAWSRTPAWPSSRGSTGRHTQPDSPNLEQVIIGQSGGQGRDLTSLIVTQGDLLTMLEVEGWQATDNSVAADCFCPSAVTFKANIFNTK